MTKFITPVSMRVTKEQLDYLGKELESRGYKADVIGNCSEFPIIVNDLSGYLGDYSNVFEGEKDNYSRHFIDHYNPELFLALASMTDEEFGIKGEWVVFTPESTPRFTEGKLYKLIRTMKYGTNCVIDDNGNENGWANNINHFRKATKEEIINHFTKQTKETMRTESNHPVTRKQMREIYDIACLVWQPKIENLTAEYLGTFCNDGYLPNSIVKEMFNAATSDQKPVLERIFPNYGKTVLSIDTPVMVSESVKEWRVRYYKESDLCFVEGFKSAESSNTCEWKYIVPVTEFDFNDLESNKKRSIV